MGYRVLVHSSCCMYEVHSTSCIETRLKSWFILKNASNTRKAHWQMPALFASSGSSELMPATAATFDRWHQNLLNKTTTNLLVNQLTLMLILMLTVTITLTLTLTRMTQEAPPNPRTHDHNYVSQGEICTIILTPLIR